MSVRVPIGCQWGASGNDMSCAGEATLLCIARCSMSTTCAWLGQGGGRVACSFDEHVHMFDCVDVVNTTQAAMCRCIQRRVLTYSRSSGGDGGGRGTSTTKGVVKQRLQCEEAFTTLTRSWRRRSLWSPPKQRKMPATMVDLPAPVFSPQ